MAIRGNIKTYFILLCLNIGILSVGNIWAQDDPPVDDQSQQDAEPDDATAAEQEQPAQEDDGSEDNAAAEEQPPESGSVNDPEPVDTDTDAAVEVTAESGADEAVQPVADGAVGDSGQDSASQRRIRRLGVTVTEEFTLDLTAPVVPQQQANTPQVSLPNQTQDDLLQDLLLRLALDQGDTDAQTQLDALLVDVAGQTQGALNQGQLQLAGRLINAISTIQSDQPSLQGLRQQLQTRNRVNDLLAQAQQAIADNRLLQPEQDNALAHVNAVLALDADNAQAQQQLTTVQQGVIEQALDLAQTQFDFETAEILLGQAENIGADASTVADSRGRIEEFRGQYAQNLSSQIIQQIDSGNYDAAETDLTGLIALGGYDNEVNSLRQTLADARAYGGFQAGQLITDPFVSGAGAAPTVVVIPAGSFSMGSPDSERDRSSNEGPVRRVSFDRGFAIGRQEISVGEFKLFIDDTGYTTDAEQQGNSRVYDENNGTLLRRNDVNWRDNYQGRSADENLPVIHVSWNDASNYTQWLSQQTQRVYRLPTEAEFEYMARGGTTTIYWWGDAVPEEVVTNTTGERDSSESRRRWTAAFRRYADGHWGPAPVGSFISNPFGIYDVAGNVSEWVIDCWHGTYVQAPPDGSAWVNPGCSSRVIRGGSWSSSPEQARVAFRLSATPDARDGRVGFRVAREL